MSRTLRDLPVNTSPYTGDVFHTSGVDLLDKRISIDDIATAVREGINGAASIGGLNLDGDLLISSSGLLLARSDEDVIQSIGKAKIYGISDVMYISHFDKGTASNYALSQLVSGSTYLNAQSGQVVGIRINNGDVATFGIAEINLLKNTIVTGSLTATTSLVTDIISEYTGAGGVTIDGLLIRDGGISGSFTTTGLLTVTSGIKTNTIDEYSPGTGVTIEGIKLVDSYIEIPGHIKVDSIQEYTTSNGVTIEGLNFKDGGISESLIVTGSLTTTTSIITDLISERSPGLGVIIDGMVIRDSGIIGSLTVSASVTATTSLITNLINEYSSGSGVTIDSVLLKDGIVSSSGGIISDTIDEYSSGSGITIDSVLLKDGNVSALGGLTANIINEYSSGSGVTIDGVLLKDGSVYGDIIQGDTVEEKNTGAGVTVDGLLIKDGGILLGTGSITATTGSITLDSGNLIMTSGEIQAQNIKLEIGEAEIHSEISAAPGVTTGVPFSNKIAPRGIVPYRMLHGTNIAQGSIFTTLEFMITEIGQNIIASGCITDVSNTYVISGCYRYSSTIIRLQGVNITTGSEAYISILSGGGGTFPSTSLFF